MQTSDFDFPLPAGLIAQHPLPRRDASRMMVVERRSGRISHGRVKGLPGFFSAGEVMVINTSRVLPARTWGRTGGKDIEFLFLKPGPGAGRWEVLCRPARRAAPGTVIGFAPGLAGRVVSAGDEGRRILDFEKADVEAYLKKGGCAPLPPYIKRDMPGGPDRRADLARYQTVFARGGRSIAAPTAGLHLTPALLSAVWRRGATVARVSLDVGAATFQPIRVEALEKHSMSEEEYRVPLAAARSINAAKRLGRAVTAVGTTVVRTLESAAARPPGPGRVVGPGPGRTSLFIAPGFVFKAVDRLLTNFHLPKSSLFILTAAFAGKDLLLEAYGQAVREKYRFFSYGDCMLIL